MSAYPLTQTWETLSTGLVLHSCNKTISCPSCLSKKTSLSWRQWWLVSEPLKAYLFQWSSSYLPPFPNLIQTNLSSTYKKKKGRKVWMAIAGTCRYTCNTIMEYLHLSEHQSSVSCKSLHFCEFNNTPKMSWLIIILWNLHDFFLMGLWVRVY